MAISIPKNLRKKAHDERLSDKKVNTIDEMVNASEEALWEKNPMEALKYEKVETRKRLNWWARFTITLIIVTLLIISGLKLKHLVIPSILVSIGVV